MVKNNNSPEMEKSGQGTDSVWSSGMLWLGMFAVIWIVLYWIIRLTRDNAPEPAEFWASLVLGLITTWFLRGLQSWGRPAGRGLIRGAPITVSELSFGPLRNLVVIQLIAGIVNFFWIVIFWAIYSPYHTLSQTSWWIYGGSLFCMLLLAATLSLFSVFLLRVRRFRNVAAADPRCHVFYSLTGTGALSVIGVMLIFCYCTMTCPDDLFLLFTVLYFILLITAEILLAGLYCNTIADSRVAYHQTYGFGLGCGNHVPFKRWVVLGFFRHALIAAFFVLYIWLFRSVFVVVTRLGG